MATVASWTCPTCGALSTTPFCGDCGERGLPAAAPVAEGPLATAPESIRGFGQRLRASLITLVVSPGLITAGWIRGKRIGYLAPLSLFLWINVFFFVIQSASGLGILTWPLRIHLADDSIAWATTWLLEHRRGPSAVPDTYARAFDALESVHAKSLVIVMVPAFAVALAVLLLGRREPFRNSLVFATHFLAFTLLFLSLLFPLLAIGLRLIVATGLPPPDHHAMDLVVTGIEGAVLAAYLYAALGTVFSLSRLRRAVSTIALIAALYGILKAYHVVVFATTLYSISP